MSEPLSPLSIAHDAYSRSVMTTMKAPRLMVVSSALWRALDLGPLCGVAETPERRLFNSPCTVVKSDDLFAVALDA